MKSNQANMTTTAFKLGAGKMIPYINHCLHHYGLASECSLTFMFTVGRVGRGLDAFAQSFMLIRLNYQPRRNQSENDSKAGSTSKMENYRNLL
jgi:hypothetical protein